MKNRFFIIFSFAFILGSSFVLAQTSTGSITGVVRDGTGAVIPGVTITAVRTGTGETRTVISGDNGVYRVMNIPPGIYTLTAELAGFRTVVNEDLEVTIGEILRVDFLLEVGEITEQVIVQAESTTVQKEEGRMSQLVETEEIMDLPLNGRNPYQLAQLGPGIYPTMGVTAQDSSTNHGDTFVVNGQRHRANNYLMDGSDNNYVGIAGIPSVTPQVDIIEEFRVHSNNFSAEYGRNAGAIINILTKSGTNQFHGTVYEYHRNDALDAREWFDDEKPPLIQHTFGFTAGGPILTDKLFFFGGYEGFRETSGESSEFTVETQQLVDFVKQNRSGSNADLLFSRFPLTKGTPSTGKDIGSPDPGVGKDGIPDVAEISLFDASKDETNQWNIRIDNSISDNDKLYGRFTRQVSESPPTIVRPSVDRVGKVTEQALTISETHVFSPVVVNEFRAGWNEREPNFDVQEGTFDIPTISISGFSPDFGAASNIPQFFARHTYQLSNQLSWARGDHSLRMGFEYRHGQENSDFQAATRGIYSFDDIFEFVNDNPFSQSNLIDANTGRPIGTPRHFRVNEWGLYLQDDFKILPNLTINMGLRYENFRPPYEKDAVQSNIMLGQGSNIFERYISSTIEVFPEGKDIYEPDNNNLAPRLGFAWDPTGEGKWAVRGGYGISYNRIFMNITSNIKFNPPFAKRVTANTSNQLPILYTIPTQVDPSLAFGFATGRINPNFLDPDLATTYVHSIFFGIQREMFGDWLLEANYVSTLGHKLYAQEHYNRFTGDLLDGKLEGHNQLWTSNDDFLTASINQAYHGGQFSVTKRFRDGLGFRANYTWAKNMDDDSDVFGTTSEDSGSSAIENRKLDRARSSINVSNRLAASWVWEIPWLSSADNWFARNVLGGWQLNGLIALQDGSPAMINADSSSWRSRLRSKLDRSVRIRRGDFNGDGHTSDRPNAPSFTQKDVKPAESRMGSIFAAFVPQGEDARFAFPRPAAGTNGTLGRNTFFFDGFNSVDFSVFKNMRMRWFGGEEATWQFRAEFFNLFNNVNTNSWEENIASSRFGRSRSTQDAREIQFALKFIF
ncbi:TonB-dependent receptor [Acidobacteria bacterium AH-259-L09]|nr:TonB-dependent receptor [Acidobacteria bacterium AH-259-L09]